MDQTTNNEPENINTKTLNRGDKIVYQVWLDTTHLTPENKINKLGITDDYDETSVAFKVLRYTTVLLDRTLQTYLISQMRMVLS